jgi:uncharacterized membrane protein
MLFPVGPPIKYSRVVLSFGVAVPVFAALGGLATFATGAALWKGLAAGAAVGAFFGLMLSGLCPRRVNAVFGPADRDAPGRDA